MEPKGAIIFLPREGGLPSPLLSDLLFDPAALWLAEALKSYGAERFLVVCPDEDRDRAQPCFPADATFVTTGTPDATGQLTAFLTASAGEVAVIARPVLLAPKESSFTARSAPGGVLSLDGAALARALGEGVNFEKALADLGRTEPWRDKVISLEGDAFHRCRVVEAAARELGVDRMLRSGVRVMDAASAYVGPAAWVGAGSVLLPGAILRGRTMVGIDCELGPHTMIRDCSIGSRVVVNASQLNESVVEDEAKIGPFAYVRPNSHIGKGVKVGDFVEVKNSVIGPGTKISHLTYVGDSDVGAGVNFGCGTVTVNYDGATKFRTKIGDGAFIGCNTNLVAPVSVGEGAYTAAGSTITADVPADSLAIARSQQTVKKQWAAKRRKKNGQK